MFYIEISHHSQRWRDGKFTNGEMLSIVEPPYESMEAAEADLGVRGWVTRSFPTETYYLKWPVTGRTLKAHIRQFEKFKNF